MMVIRHSKIMAHLVKAQMPFSLDQLKRLDRSIKQVDVLLIGKYDIRYKTLSLVMSLVVVWF